MDFDKDLQSIQEVRWLVAKAVVAQKELAKMSQQQVDGIAKAIADACAAQSERLAFFASSRKLHQPFRIAIGL